MPFDGVTAASSVYRPGVQDHRRLRVWRKAIALAVNVRRATTRYPPRGYGELKAQTVSSAESVVNTIVEGCGASSQRDFARFLEMSIRSNKELEGELELASFYEILPRKDWLALGGQTVDVRRMLIGLRKKVLQSNSPPDPSQSIGHAERTTDGTNHPARPLAADGSGAADGLKLND